MSRYLLGKDAANDLEVIWDYIARDDEQAASRWIARLLEACEMLAKSPGIGHHRQDLTRLPVLFWPVGAYLIVYRRQTESIEIVAVTQGARDIPTFMSQRIE